MRLQEFMDILFPYRGFMREEIAYLKSQLAQERRRVDILQTALVDAKRPTVQMVRPITPPKKKVPLGWDATRAEERNAAREDKPEGVPAGPDAGSEDASEGDGAVA